MPIFSPAVSAAEALPTPAFSAFPLTCWDWNESQIAALASLRRVVDDGFVFGAVTGPKKSGKSAIIAELLSSSKSKTRICIDIHNPEQISLKSITFLKKEIVRVNNHFRVTGAQILFVIDNAHTASNELFTLLNIFAGARTSFGCPQMILAGEPDLWNRLSSPYYEKLHRRIALRCFLESLPRD